LRVERVGHAALRIVPVGLILLDVVVENDQAAGIGEVAKVVHENAVNVVLRGLGRYVLHGFGVEVVERNADHLDRDAGFLLPHVERGRGALWERPSIVADGAVEHRADELLGRLAFGLELLDALDRAAGRH